jgi:hypothetical protein
MLTCARNGCEVEYSRKTHNQKYCCDECCRLATNQRIMQKYYASRARKLGQKRVCEDCNITKLSRYNDSAICNSCELKRTVSMKESVLNMLSAVSWQS